MLLQLVNIVYILSKQHIYSNNVTGGVDYHSGPYNITFPAGITTIPFNVSIYNDTVLEGNEQFTLNINIITNSSSRATVIITDDDSKMSLHKKPRLTIVGCDAKKKQAVHDKRVCYLHNTICSTIVKFINALNKLPLKLLLCY